MATFLFKKGFVGREHFPSTSINSSVTQLSKVVLTALPRWIVQLSIDRIIYSVDLNLKGNWSPINTGHSITLIAIYHPHPRQSAHKSIVNLPVL